MRSAFYNSTFGFDNPNLPFPPNSALANPSLTHNRIYINDGNGVTLPPTWFIAESGSLFRTYPNANCGLWWPAESTTPFGWNGRLEFGAISSGPMPNEDFEQFVGKVLENSTYSVILETGANVEGQVVDVGDPDFQPGFTTIEGMTVIP
jgi:hypothetical protein